MKKTLIASLLVTITLLFQACSTTEYVYIKSKPFNFQTVEQPKKRDIRVYAPDIKLYEGYVTNFRNIIDFHNQQIADYEKSFNENNTTKGE